MLMFNAGNQAQVNADEVIGVSPTAILSEKDMQAAVNLSSGNSRSAIFMKNGVVFLSEVSVETIIKRMQP